MASKKKGKGIFRRIVSGLSAIALAVTTLVTAFPITASADPSVGGYGMIMSGTILSSGNASIYALEIARRTNSGLGWDNFSPQFCIGRGQGVYAGNAYKKVSETSSKLNSTQRKMISEICKYGFVGQGYTRICAYSPCACGQCNTVKNGHTGREWYVATQALIWEVAYRNDNGTYKNKRNADFTGGGQYRYLAANYRNAAACYDSIVNAIQTFRRTPTGCAGTYTFTYNTSTNRYEARVPITALRNATSQSAYIQSNGTYYYFTSDNKGHAINDINWTYSPSTGYVTFYTSKVFTGTKNMSFNRAVTGGKATYEEWHNVDVATRQPVARGNGADPQGNTVHFNLQATGGFTFRKQWKNVDSTDTTLIKSVVADAEFVLRKGTTYYNFTKQAEGNYVYNGTTTTNLASATKMKTVLTSGGGEGIIWMDGLPAGQYTVDEIPKYFNKHSCRMGNGDGVYYTYFRAGSVNVNVVAGKKPAQDTMTSPMMNWYSFQHADLEVYKQDDKYNGIQGATFGLYVDYTELRNNNGNGTPQKYDYVIERDGNILTRNGVQWKVGTQVQTATSDIHGKVDFGSVPAYAYIGENVYRFRYIVKELEAPKGYALSADGVDGHSIKMDAKAHFAQGQYTGETYFTNAPQRMEIAINKVDDKGKKLQGAVFGLYSNQDGLELRDINKELYTFDDIGVYNKGDLIAYGTTDSNGELVFGDERGQVLCRKLNEQTGVMRNLLEGKYYVQEITPPKNYVANDKKYEFTFTPNNKTEKVVFEYEATVPNKHKNGEITVIKEGYNNVKLAGAEFKLYSANKTVTVNGKDYAAGQTIASGKTGTDGKLVFDKRVPTGYEYIIEETKAPNGYALSSNSKKTFSLDDNNSVAEYIKLSRTFTNDAYGEVTVVKNDMDGVALAGAKFAIYTSENDAKNGTNAVATGSTKKNSDGTVSPVTFTKLLPDTHTYWLVETTPPSGFLAKGTVSINGGAAKEITQAKQPIKLIFKDVDGTPTTYARYSKAVFKNTEQEARITVNKVGTDGVTSIPLANAEFKITAAENIYSQNGKLKYTKGTLVKSGIKTDSNGKLVISSDQTDGIGTAKAKLYCGTYTVTETKAPNGYRLPSNPSQNVTITADGAPTAQFKNKSIPVTNYTGVAIRAYKADKQTGKLIAGARYGLYAAQDVKSLDGKTVLWKKNALIATSTTTDTNGVSKFYRSNSTEEISLLFGYKYFVKEIKPPQGYKLDKEWQWDIDLTSYSSASANLPTLIENNGKNGNAKPNINEPQKVSINVYKYDTETKKPLAGAQFKLCAGKDIYKADGTILYAKNATISTVTTDSNGKGSFSVKVPVNNTYYVEETKAPINYVYLNKNHFISEYFTPEYKGDEQHFTADYVLDTIEVGNTYQKGTITVIKKDAETKTPLAGAEFTLYAMDDVTIPALNKSYNAGDKITAKTTGKDGKVVFGLTSDKKDGVLPVNHKYKVVETKPPTGYTSKGEAQEFELKYAVNIQFVQVDDEDTPYYNDYQTGNVVVKKVYNDGTKKPLAGAQFTLYAGEDVLNAAGKTYTPKVKNADGTTKFQ